MRLYKYCPWNSNKHIKANLKNSILYFQKPELLNDPFDVFPAAQKTKKISVSDDLSAAIIQNVRNNIGVCCFTTDPQNLVMWAHYADKHSGLCLSFDFPDNKNIINPSPNWNNIQRKANISVTPQIVTYAKTRPKMDFYSDSTNFTNFFLTKYEAWKYEQEYRAFIVEDYGEFNYPPAYLTGIIAGCKMADKDLAELRELIKDLSCPVDLFMTIPEHNAFRLDIEKI
ncbi:MAG: DUF2971 domain-containing protein [Pelosinus sp.]|nr:DUF2971 domain-containing protein [Pelosinus sp.]